MFVGWPTIKTVLGNLLLPGYVDRVLAETAYEGQQYDGLVAPDRRDNLWEPVPNDFGAHGDFDQGAQPSSSLLWMDIHRKMIAIGFSAIAAVLVGRAVLKGRN
jgi:hypothetical protein